MRTSAGGWLRPVLVAVTVLAALAAPSAAGAQVAGLSVAVTPMFPSNVQLGAQNQPAVLTVSNRTQGAPFNAQSVRINDIRLNPSCSGGPSGSVPCSQAEARPVTGQPVMAVDSPATGKAGSACAGTTFTVSAPNAAGTVVLTPSVPVVLGPSSVGGPAAECTVDLTFDVKQRPLDGTTLAVAMVDAQTPLPGQTGTTGSATASGSTVLIRVAQVSPSISTLAAPRAVDEGASFSGTGVITGIAGGPALTGKAVVRLYRSRLPAFPDCSGPPYAASTVSVSPLVADPATGAPRAVASFTPSPAPPSGNYAFVVSYDESDADVSYGPAASSCADPLARVTANPILPTIRVDQTAGTAVLDEPGGPVVFSVVITNIGARPVTLTSLRDDLYGDLDGQGTCDVAPTGSTPPTAPLLAANGGTYRCSYTSDVPVAGTGVGGQSHVDVLTARATDADGYVATDSDDTTVDIVSVPPVIAVIHEVDPSSMPQPGGAFLHTVTVRNNSAVEAATITALTDDVYGNIATLAKSTCGAVVGVVLAPGASSSPCTFNADFSGPAGATLTDAVAAIVVDDDGQTAKATDTATVAITSGIAGSDYVPLSPVRIEDTRFGTGNLGGPLGPGTTVEVQIAGRGGVPADAVAVVLNVTVTAPTAAGYLTLYPAGRAQPLAANLNFTPGRTVANLAVVRLGTGGRLAMYNPAGSTHVVFDVGGYYVDATGNAGHLRSLVPARIADTRAGIGGVRLGPGGSLDLQVTGRGGAPATGVSAAVLNVAVTDPTAPSYLTVYPSGEPRPLAANLNFTAGETVSNRTMTKVGAGGKVTIFNAAGSTDVVVDLGGTFTDASSSDPQGAYTPVTPSRIFDSRTGVGTNVGALLSGGSADVQVAGQGGVPASGARAVILNVVATEPINLGYLTISPADVVRPLVSDLNYALLETRANLVVVRLSDLGQIDLFTSTQAHVVIDIAGWFS